MIRQKVHSFAVTADAAGMLRQAFGDRRLARMEHEARTGGLADAAAAYAGAASPALIVAEVTDHDRMLDDLDLLAEVCDAGSNVILLGRANDVETYRTLRRHAVADYLVVPSPPGQLVEAVLQIHADPRQRPMGKVIAFIGAKGGCGSSTIAHNTAFELARLADADVLLADLDVPFGAADLNFNLECPTGIRNVLAEPERIDDILLQRFSVKYGERLFLLAAPAQLDIDYGIRGDAIETAIEAMRRETSHLVLDLPHQWNGWIQRCLRHADAIVVSAGCDLASLRNARNLIDLLAAERAADAPPLVVLNRVSPRRKGDASPEEFQKTLGAGSSVIIPEDADAFGAAAAEGRMITEVRPKSKPADAMRRLAAAPVQRDGKAKPKKAAPASRWTGAAARLLAFARS